MKYKKMFNIQKKILKMMVNFNNKNNKFNKILIFKVLKQKLK